MVFLGQGGTGKSRTINAFMDFSTRWGLASRVSIVAPSGVAASQINGRTFHGWAQVPFAFNEEGDTEASGAQNLEPTMQHLYMVIIDEISMLPLHVFGKGFRNMQNLCADTSAYAGLDVVMVGDFYQLQPPGGKIVFQYGDKITENYGRELWLLVNTVIELTEHKRCQDEKLDIVLNALRTGEFSEEADSLIKSRTVGADLAIPTMSTLILQWNNDVNDHNFMAPHTIQGIEKISVEYSGHRQALLLPFLQKVVVRGALLFLSIFR